MKAGEVSYIITEGAGSPTFENIWGNRCSVLNLCRYYAEAKRLDAAFVTGEMVFDEYENGCPIAAAVIKRYAKEIAVQIFNIQAILDPQLFAIGGGISARSQFISSIENELDAMYASCDYPVPHAKITVCKFGNDANLIGVVQTYMAKYGETIY